MNDEYAEPLRPTDSALERTGIEEIRADIAAWAKGLQAELASWTEELQTDVVARAEELRAEAATRAGEFAAQLAAQADAIATLTASADSLNEATAAAQAQTDTDAAVVRQELESLRRLVEERQEQLTGDATAAHAAQVDALQAVAEAQQAGQHLEGEVVQLRSEVEALRRQLELQAARPTGKRSKHEKKRKR